MILVDFRLEPWQVSSGTVVSLIATPQEKQLIVLSCAIGLACIAFLVRRSGRINEKAQSEDTTLRHDLHDTAEQAIGM